MPRDGTPTKLAIMDAAEALILDQGYAGSSIDRIIAKAGITKGAFFYHFKSKPDLALALVERFAEYDLHHLETKMARAETLSRDPLQQILIFIGLFREEMGELTGPYPGCLFASYLQEAGLFDEKTLGVIRASLMIWRKQLAIKFNAVAVLHPPRLPVDMDDLADALWVTFEGAFLLAKTVDDAQVIARQLDHYRNYLELLFEEHR